MSKYVALNLRIEPDLKQWFEQEAIDRSVASGKITSTSEVVREVLLNYTKEVSNEQKEAAKA